MSNSKTVGVICEQGTEECISILSAIAQFFGLRVNYSHTPDHCSLSGIIIITERAEWKDIQAWGNIPSIRIVKSDLKEKTTVQFGAGALSPLPYRGRSVLTNIALPYDSLDCKGEVIAKASDKPLWTTNIKGEIREDLCWVSNPWIKEGDCLFEHLNGNRFMDVLPLLEWMRWIKDKKDWKHSPIRACFMFDDPNLHSTRYGFLDYKQLAKEGRKHNFHTSIATVPLDGYFLSNAAIRIFRENTENISLLVHGNNHTHRELARPQSLREKLALLQQSLYRIEQLENKTQLKVSKVMVPPHGVCSRGMMKAMVIGGYEAACISNGSVRAANHNEKWTETMGMFSATIIEGLPVIPRFRLDHNPESHILLASYLNQPIIPVGHHWDLVDGIEILTSAASIINGLGTVEWGDMRYIARTNYRYDIRGNVMRIQTFSRITTIKVPPNITELELEVPWLDAEFEYIECLNSLTVTETFSCERNTKNLSFRVTPKSTVHIIVSRKVSDSELPLSMPRTQMATILRKILVEMRDRSMPYFPRKWVRR